MKLLNRKWLAPLSFLLLLVGCSNDEETTTTNKHTDSRETTEGAYSVIDDRGVEVSFESVPETIISLQPSNTEILFELGAGDKIIGATEYDTYPNEALEIERVSDLSTVNTERVVELNPDVVFAYTSGAEAQVEQLESAGIKVFVIRSASSIEDVYGDIKQIASVVDLEEKGDQVIAGIQKQIATVQEKIAKLDEKKKVYFEIAPAPDIWSIGSGTFQQEIITASGVENIYADQQEWFAVSEEDIITRNPEAIVTTVHYTENPVADILSRTSWKSISAVQNKEVYVINSDIFDRPGPRIGQAVEMLAKTIYPNLFK